MLNNKIEPLKKYYVIVCATINLPEMISNCMLDDKTERVTFEEAYKRRDQFQSFCSFNVMRYAVRMER